MSPITHALASWVVAGAAKLEPRDRALVMIAGVAPDADGAGILVELATQNSSHPLLWWSEYHHVLGHNLGFCLLVVAAVSLLAARRGITALLAAVAFHFHLLCDLAGSRGPDGYQWPIPYLMPFSKTWQLQWSAQWALNAWPNIAFTAALLAITIYLAWRRGFSPLGIASTTADGVFVSTLRGRFGQPAS